jgi:hypothetical protein
LIDDEINRRKYLSYPEKIGNKYENEPDKVYSEDTIEEFEDKNSFWR